MGGGGSTKAGAEERDLRTNLLNLTGFWETLIQLSLVSGYSRTVGAPRNRSSEIIENQPTLWSRTSPCAIARNREVFRATDGQEVTFPAAFAEL